jgi:hypothetical protein
MLNESKGHLQKLLPNSDGGKCDNYITNFALVMGQLRAMLYKVNGPLLINYVQVNINNEFNNMGLISIVM